MNKIFYKDKILYIELSLNEEVIKRDINSYNSLDSVEECKSILKEVTSKLIDDYIESLKS